MIERADQLVLDYVSKAADAAHGVLPPRQRIDFVAVLRRRIDAERAGADDPVAVARVLARFGDPAALVRRELRRLGREAPSPSPDNPPGRPEPRVSEEESQESGSSRGLRGLQGLRGLWGAQGSRGTGAAGDVGDVRDVRDVGGARSSRRSREDSGTVPRPREDAAGAHGRADRSSGRAADPTVAFADHPPVAVPLSAPTSEGPAPEDSDRAQGGSAPEDRDPASKRLVPEDRDAISTGSVPEDPDSPSAGSGPEGPDSTFTGSGPEIPGSTPRDAVPGPDGPGHAQEGPRALAAPDTAGPSSSPSSPSGGAETAGRAPSAAREATPGDPGLPPSRRPVRGHPYASTGARPDAGEPARGHLAPDRPGSEPEPDRPGSERPEPDAPEASRASRWAERIFPARSRLSPAAPEEDEPDVPAGSRPRSETDAADEWEDAVESDPPTEEIPPVQDPLPPPVAPREAAERPREAREAEEAGKPREKREEAPPEAPRGRPGGAQDRPGLPPGVARGMREAEERLARRKTRARPDWLRRRRPARSREDVVPGTEDARTILLSHRREMIGLGLLSLAGLLIPFPLAPIAIFRIPVLVWAVAVLVVILCENWHTSDKALGLAAPIVSYSLGGGLVALVRARNDLGAVIDEFFTISGLMFMLGTAWAVFWLAYRLLNPPVPVGRGVRRPG